MLNKKKIIAIVLFVLIGFVVFTFANPRQNLEPTTETEPTVEEPTQIQPVVQPIAQPVVQVIDNAPVINVEPGLVKVVDGYEYDVLEGVTVVDDIDTNLNVTTSMVETEDGFEVTYRAVDRSGNIATNTRTIVILDKDGDEDNDHYTNEEEMEAETDFDDEEDHPEYDYNPTIDLSDTTKTSVVYDQVDELTAVCADNFQTEGVTCVVDQSNIDFEKVGKYEVTVTATDILGNETVETFYYEVTKRTANVVISMAFGVPAIAVDTHVFRVSNRLGLADAKDVALTQKQLEKNIPRDKWIKMHYSLVLHGRYVCKSQRPNCSACELKTFCKYYKNK